MRRENKTRVLIALQNTDDKVGIVWNEFCLHEFYGCIKPVMIYTFGEELADIYTWIISMTTKVVPVIAQQIELERKV